ncbi:uncharacterized protein LOC123316787 [Coccinella septempunctata]|uniref:uncharacterized protein LOC123316787 n=1 Tax=Coccinella septempunctata TaxID=41139 RepID=UPI001D06B3B2|nr:uncharacterized protein LOC123316787 [Coccinella septempunctata]
MRYTSRTGLAPSATKKLLRRNRSGKNLDFKPDARPAPFVLKPLAGIYNPYRYGCSLLCNHPTDEDARELLRRAKDTWVNESRRTILHEDEIAAIRDNLEHLQMYSKQNDTIQTPVIEAIPEELFRRYTETDSRPLTPAPTLSSSATRASGSRRCFTPDPIPISTVKEKTMLVLDLRRSHSQDLICGGNAFLDPPLILIQQVPTRRGSLDSFIGNSNRAKHALRMPATARTTNTQKDVSPKNEPPMDPEDDDRKTDEENDENYIKRRGKRRRKKRNGSTALLVQTSTDPETQVGTVGLDSNNASTRPSLVPGSAEEAAVQKSASQNLNDTKKSGLFRNVESFLDFDILKLLRRELTTEIYDNEFDWKRRIALGEALKTLTNEKNNCEELLALQSELNLPPINTDLWISIPRVFSRQNARFELPPFSNMLKDMTPMEYIADNVDVTNRRKIMYNSIFNKFRMKEVDKERRLLGKNILDALHLLMGQKLPIQPLEDFKELVGWNDEELYDFKTFSCICATCERLLASKYSKTVPDRKADPCHELESADFESLNRKLQGQNANERLVKILFGIKNL